MLGIKTLSVAVVIVVGVSAACGNSAVAKSPREIAAVSRLLAEKQENCRIEAKRQKLSFLKRRSFVRRCIKDRS